MQNTITFTEFRKQASTLFNAVEGGKTFIIVRHGKPIAEILPYRAVSPLPAWKRRGLRLQLTGQSLAKAILAEREETNESRI